MMLKELTTRKLEKKTILRGDTTYKREKKSIRGLPFGTLKEGKQKKSFENYEILLKRKLFHFR